MLIKFISESGQKKNFDKNQYNKFQRNLFQKLFSAGNGFKGVQSRSEGALARCILAGVPCSFICETIGDRSIPDHDATVVL